MLWLCSEAPGWSFGGGKAKNRCLIRLWLRTSTSSSSVEKGYESRLLQAGVKTRQAVQQAEVQLIGRLNSMVMESKLVTHRKILRETKRWNSKDKTIWHRREGKHGLNTQGGGRQLDTGRKLDRKTGVR